MIRSHNLGELNISHLNQKVTLAGWVHKTRDLGGMTFIDLRDRYGITQLAFNIENNEELCIKARSLGREYVIQIIGTVIERSSKNLNLSTGEIEIDVAELKILNPSKVPPFTIESETDGGEELRMKYRYLDIRRVPIKENLLLRNKVSIETRKYLNSKDFVEVETPYLIKSTPEGARDFIVPSRMNEGQFYALPQSPQTFKQLLMVGGIDKYYQIVKCFRDEDLRADRQPEFTQIDCEMSFVTQDDILETFENLTKHLIKEIKGIEVKDFPRITHEKAISLYGTDKPDIRFNMTFVDLTNISKGMDFNVFDNSEIIIGIKVEKCADFSRKKLDALIDFVKTPQVGATGLVYCKFNSDGTTKSSVDKFFDENSKIRWKEKSECQDGDLLLIMSGEKNKTQKALGILRLKLAEDLGLRKSNQFTPLWVVDFPLLEWDEDSKRFHAMHHPFTAPKEEDFHKIESEPKAVRANAYDLVLNGNEIGGGSIRIHDKELQKTMLHHLGFSEAEAKEKPK